jgi:hypothetical protein
MKKDKTQENDLKVIKKVEDIKIKKVCPKIKTKKIIVCNVN